MSRQKFEFECSTKTVVVASFAAGVLLFAVLMAGGYFYGSYQGQQERIKELISESVKPCVWSPPHSE
ncbi:hypothetical protein PsaNZ64_13870 [Pseudomonas syringae pv. actinidiae]|uniref:Uncharacterized protein n=1 Tax=Pseudomonas syringae pv. actinidiae TaxID=103796 RepID=A0A2P0QF98_PSESF|nr:hypothetical protein PsaNZ47_29900 [Pseudomonas syringae pv. actinidiae]ARO44935.1 hypothetical protein [Pseudomonas syringae pv. actinidiae]ARO45038.1 hypothetical protein [Pseudomonas syringae pv. actinidiae]ARO45131.1 hypothetical protein [Pseudomonas syringae pv. actinidiae]OKS54977.1 hypothetical protein PsaNZ62_13595 [Pseudomonas syringae pv. actinidiae]